MHPRQKKIIVVVVIFIVAESCSTQHSSAITNQKGIVDALHIQRAQD